jgi:SAM-dependent methyltransferase
MDLIQFIRNLEVSKSISPHDKMYREESPAHYFYVGRSNLLTILNILNIRASYPGGDAGLNTILDFGCGHGRFTRWLKAAFPGVEISVTDYDRTGVDWCVSNLGCMDCGEDLLPNFYDLIWLGSVFTHLPEHIAEPLLRRLMDSLRPNGVLAFTTQGRFSVERMKQFGWSTDGRRWMHYSIDQPSFEFVAKGYRESGYGYIDYPEQKDYGVCIARPGWYSNIALKTDNFIQILFQEKGSDNHQDVSAFMRASLLDLSKGPLIRE